MNSRFLLVLVGCLGLTACSRLHVEAAGESLREDEIRLYFEYTDDDSPPCVGARVNWKGEELHVTLVEAPPFGVPAVPTSELDKPYVEVPLDPSIFEREGELRVFVQGESAGVWRRDGKR